MNSAWDYPTAQTVWGPEEYEAIARVVASGQFTRGGEVATFERELAGYHGVKHAICVNSGSSANLVAVAALFHVERNPLQRGDKVAVPAFAWATTYAPLIQMGLDLVLIDAAAETWNADPFLPFPPDALRLVLFAPMLGNPAYAPMWARWKDRGYWLIEDACESIGASVDRQRCGTFGHMSTTSFFFSHQLSAIEGGAILTDDDELGRLCRLLADHGWTRNTERAQRLVDETKFVLPGFNLRPVEMHCAIGRAQLKKLDKGRGWRMRNWQAFVAATAYLPIEIPTLIGNANPFGIHFLMPDSETRERAVVALRARGIDCRLPGGGSFRLQPFGKQWSNQHTPVADEIHRRGLMIGNGPLDLRNWIDGAARILGEVLV